MDRAARTHPGKGRERAKSIHISSIGTDCLLTTEVWIGHLRLPSSINSGGALSGEFGANGIELMIGVKNANAHMRHGRIMRHVGAAGRTLRWYLRVGGGRVVGAPI
eukprot:Gregarina_sp_Poly_1__6543@NODE_3506_length_1045_cov_82_763804_g654_i3_p2_GENE_NODE_3506_length_1045_cov_82_763804_g654_i3NODE_3506_length_1045_cov_82_763804_g654_i3_p2_ORF_typecomplete_len106_score3_65DUF3710/PF12502_8/0_12_NODE_3506_length_1045_cov_82_763804_g654_i3485802